MPLALLLLAACTGPRMHRLLFEPHPSDAPIDAACRPSDEGVDADAAFEGDTCREQREVLQSWRPQPAVDVDDTVRFVLLGDAGVRGPDDPRVVAEGPRAVAAAAKRACGDGCDAAVFLGDNVYTNGVEGPDDTAWLAAFVDLYAWAGDLRFVLGNHDWGPVRFGEYEAPDRDRAQRLFRDLAALDAANDDLVIGGDAHFWRAEAGPAALVGLDTNFVVRRCGRRWGRGVRCKGDPSARDREHTPLQAAVHGLVKDDDPWMIVVGHHPWRSNGHHGDAGRYLDEGLPLWRGKAFARLLDEEVTPHGHLYVAGHDHNTQLHLGGPEPASLVVGAGGKTSGPGRWPAGKRTALAVESYCTLGFAIVEASAETLAVEVHRITAAYDAASEEDYAQCTADLERHRPELVAAPGCDRFERTRDGAWRATGCDAGE